MDEKKFDVQQVCENGHQITSHYNEWPEERKCFCEICGASTITECPECKQKIQGAKRKYENRHRKTLEDIVPVPENCKYCGKPYPWNQKILLTVPVLEKSNKLNKEAASEKEDETKKSSKKQEGFLEPKAPEILQKILWILKYGRKHWKLILLAIGILVILYIFAK